MTDSESRICPACKSSNEDDAAYCDQCGQPLNPVAPSEGGDDGNCPACGGAVQSRGDGKGVCSKCGLELFETAEDGSAATAPATGLADRTIAAVGLAEKLTETVLAKSRSGMTLEQAVAEGCREVLGHAPHAEAAAGATVPCPLCGVANPESSSRCSGCGLWFEALRSPQPCPRCERPVSGEGQCACGAILTLPKLLDYIEPSVRWVCSRCRAPYAVPQPNCPDCGGSLLSADRIKAFAADAG